MNALTANGCQAQVTRLRTFTAVGICVYITKAALARLRREFHRSLHLQCSDHLATTNLLASPLVLLVVCERQALLRPLAGLLKGHIVQLLGEAIRIPKAMPPC